MFSFPVVYAPIILFVVTCECGLLETQEVLQITEAKQRQVSDFNNKKRRFKGLQEGEAGKGLDQRVVQHKSSNEHSEIKILTTHTNRQKADRQDQGGHNAHINVTSWRGTKEVKWFMYRRVIRK